MTGKFHIRKSFIAETPFYEVWGSAFSCQDLYKLVGKNQFMSTFIFKDNSESSKRFGKSVTGLIYYSKDEICVLEGVNKDQNAELNRIKIDSPMTEMGIVQREELKYGGLPVLDVEYISYTPRKRLQECYETGEKKVPNIVYIECKDDSNVDADKLYQSLIISKINGKTELIPYEKEKFIGITLGINNGHIDSRLLTFLGFDLKKVQSSSNIWYHLYKTKERRGKISEDEKSKLRDIEFIQQTQNIMRLFSEIKKCDIKSDELSKKRVILESIMTSLSKFEPNILLYGKKQVFWDIDSYLHIVIRHVKQFQIGHFKSKTPFPYKFEDLETLIAQVLARIEDEVRRHFAEKIEKDFKRVGKMSVLFNEDYYSVQIALAGC